MDDETKARVDAFLGELTELALKHGVLIRSCGCCGSPWIDEAPEDWDDRGLYVVDREGFDLAWRDAKEV